MMADSVKPASLNCTVLVDLVVKTLAVFDADINRLYAAESKVIQLFDSIRRNSQSQKKAFTDLRRELYNTRRFSVQLQVNLRNFETLKQQLFELSAANGSKYKDLTERVSRTERRVTETVTEFSRKLQSWSVTLRSLESVGNDSSSLSDALTAQQSDKSNTDYLLSETNDDINVPQHGRIALSDDVEALRTERDYEEGLETLATDMQSMHEMYQTVRDAVEEQSVAMRNIEDHVEAAHENVQQGSLALRAAVRAKQAALPLTGMLIGAALGGPVGLAVGLKVGLVAAAGGAGVGYVSGRMIKKKMQNIETPAIEMSTLPN